MLCPFFAPLSLTIPWALCPYPHPCFLPPNRPLRNGRTPGGELVYRYLRGFCCRCASVEGKRPEA
eukprot:3500147-Pyramimonas_sp.AAC.1